MLRKKIKIYDCFFYYDEIEMLKLRLNLLEKEVDLFVIVEMEQDFKLQKKLNFLNLRELEGLVPLEKIKLIKIPSLNSELVIETYKSFRKKSSIDLIEEVGITDLDLKKYSLCKLTEFLLNQDFLLDDLIFLSDVDEILDLSNLEKMKSLIKYGPVTSNNQNFIWSDEFKLSLKHEGSILFTFAQLVSNKNIFEKYFHKNTFRGNINNVSSGWHLSHFYSVDRTLNKMNLLYPNKKISKIDLIKSILNLQHPIKNIFGIHENLIDNEDILPFETRILPKQYLGRIKPKKILINLKGTFSSNSNYFDSIYNFNVEEKFLPKKEIYKNSQTFFVLNEIPIFLKDKSLLNKDIVCVILESHVSMPELEKDYTYIDNQKRFAIFEWKTIKKNTLSDLIFPETT